MEQFDVLKKSLFAGLPAELKLLLIYVLQDLGMQEAAVKLMKQERIAMPDPIIEPEALLPYQRVASTAAGLWQIWYQERIKRELKTAFHSNRKELEILRDLASAEQLNTEVIAEKMRAYLDMKLDGKNEIHCKIAQEGWPLWALRYYYNALGNEQELQNEKKEWSK